MTTTPSEVSDVKIVGDKIMLYNFNRSRSENIIHLVNEIDVYESILNNSLTADIGISEGIELMNEFPINGEEFIEFTIQTPNRKQINYTFFVESIVGQRSDDSSLMKHYILRCVTEDYLNNSYTLFSRRFRDMDYMTSVASIIRQNLRSSKDLKLERTKGKFDLTVNNVRPFQVIDLIRERAVSAEGNKSSLFFFYEDNERYNFVTLEKLIEERKSIADNLVFVYDISNRASNVEEVVNVRNILSYQTTNQGSSIQKIRTGRMANQVRQFDILHGTYYEKFEYNNLADSSEFKKTDDNIDFNSDAFNSRVTASPGRSSFVCKDGTRPEMEHNKTIPYKGPFQEKISQYGVTIRVYGDTNILVGDMVRLDIPEITGTTTEPKPQEIFSKNYIIFNQRHMLRKNGTGNFDHYMSLDLRKPNLSRRGLG